MKHYFNPFKPVEIAYNYVVSKIDTHSQKPAGDKNCDWDLKVATNLDSKPTPNIQFFYITDLLQTYPFSSNLTFLWSVLLLIAECPDSKWMIECGI